MCKEKDLICPNCGEYDNIVHRMLEWETFYIRGLTADKEVVYDSDSYYQEDVKGVISIENTPINDYDCAHLHCNACGWNWLNTRSHKFE